ncbi:MAG TPA: hypothetical protein VK163_06240 [Opitutaceae bacterium]|nr:hypothetical protein [Opitutaceae bacterium]
MRAFFFRRSWRERVLLLVVLTVGVVIWLAAVLARGRTLRERWGETGQMLDTQQRWLAVAPEKAQELQSRLAQVQQGRSLNANQLVGQLDAVIKRQRIAGYRLDPPTTERKPPVALHSVSVTLDKTELATLGAFVDDLRASLPLVNIEQIVVTPDRRNPAQLDVRLKLSGLELLQ